MLKNKLQCILRPRGLRAFLSKSENNTLKILDVGCGNKSSIFIKKINPKFQIYGIDVSDYNQTLDSKNLYADYLIAKPELFDQSITEINFEFDLITSNHNIEHCNNPEKTFKAMVAKLRPGGKMFIATPSLNSIYFPARNGTLNFFDDTTHKQPVDLVKLLKSQENMVRCIFYKESYRPFFWVVVGWLNEFTSRLNGKVMLGTWDYYGFEQIMWLEKIDDQVNLRG